MMMSMILGAGSAILFLPWLVIVMAPILAALLPFYFIGNYIYKNYLSSKRIDNLIKDGSKASIGKALSA